jgi:hypothetical protein
MLMSLGQPLTFVNLILIPTSVNGEDHDHLIGILADAQGQSLVFSLQDPYRLAEWPSTAVSIEAGSKELEGNTLWQILDAQVKARLQGKRPVRHPPSINLETSIPDCLGSLTSSHSQHGAR